MRPDREFEKALAAGQRNKEVAELIENWCAHGRIKKFGGVGLIEAQTGLPIGHHAMACEHALDSGFASWDLTEAAIAFYDRNCATCSKRIAVRLPNLINLVAERDAHQKKVEEEQRVLRARLDAALQARDFVRRDIRSRQPAESVSILDFIDDLDRNQEGGGVRESLLGAAKLAPETFTSEIVEYCFGLIENKERWFFDSGLEVLAIVSQDKHRLVQCAMLCLASHSAVAIACDIVQLNADLVEPDLINGALPALVWRSEPERDPFLHADQIKDPSALVSLYKAHPKPLEAAIESKLSDRHPYQVSVGARAIFVLATTGHLKVNAFTTSLVAKLARAHLLIDERTSYRQGDDEAISRLQDALVLALADSPDEADRIVGKFLSSAPTEGEIRIYKTFVRILKPRSSWGESSPPLHPAAHLALRRLIAAATTSSEPEILRCVADAISHLPENAEALAIRERSALLGAALQLSERIDSLNKEPPAKDFLVQMERENLRQTFYSLQTNFTSWVAEAGAEEPSVRREYVDLLRKLPEGRIHAQGVLIESLHQFMHTPEGLGDVLPDLYAGMLSSSTVIRASASRSLQELKRIRQQDLPELLLESFTMHLSDPYVLVHQTAARGLERVSIPENLKQTAEDAVLNLIQAYATARNDDRFLVKAIEIYLRRFATLVQKQGNIGRVLIAFLSRVNPELYASELRWFAKDLGCVEGFSELVVKALADRSISEYQQESVLSALSALPAEAIRAKVAELVAIASSSSLNVHLVHALVETLSRVGAWAEAAEVCQSVFDSIPETLEARIRKLYATLHLIASQFELAIAEGNTSALENLAVAWREAESQIQELQIEHEKRSDPFPSLPRAHRGS